MKVPMVGVVTCMNKTIDQSQTIVFNQLASLINIKSDTTLEVIGWSAKLGSEAPTSACLLDISVGSSVSSSLMCNTDGGWAVVSRTNVSN